MERVLPNIEEMRTMNTFTVSRQPRPSFGELNIRDVLSTHLEIPGNIRLVNFAVAEQFDNHFNIERV